VSRELNDRLTAFDLFIVVGFWGLFFQKTIPCGANDDAQKHDGQAGNKPGDVYLVPREREINCRYKQREAKGVLNKKLSLFLFAKHNAHHPPV